MLLLRLVAPGVLMTIVSPARSLSRSITTSSHSFFSSFADTAALSTRNEVLTNENLSLAAENQALSEKLADITMLLDGARVPAQSVIAGVTARPPESPYDTLLVGEGSGAGVTLGMEAFGAGGVPLGAVTAVGANFARVTLFSAPGITIAGWIGKTKTPLTLIGVGAGAFKASVSRSLESTVGDIVYLPGPGALPAGSVVRIDSDSASPSVMLRIQPVLNLFSQTWVELRDTGRLFMQKNIVTDAASAATSTMP